MADGIVFIHAFPLDSSMWAPQLEYFDRREKAIAPDLPGFGAHASHQKVMSMSAAADHIARDIRSAGMQTAMVCGLSMGGYVALALWRQHPDLVAGFVFANTKASADDEAARERRRGLAERLEKEGSGFLVDNPPPLLSDEAPGELTTLVKNIISTQTAGAIAAASLGMADRPDSTADLATITVPTLVVTGSKDSLIPPEATKPMADGIANASYEVIDGAGHLSNLQEPKRFNELLVEHLKRVRGAGER